MAEPVVLSGHGVVLEPLSLTHVDDLVATASEDRSTYGFTWVPHSQGADSSSVCAADARWPILDSCATR